MLRSSHYVSAVNNGILPILNSWAGAMYLHLKIVVSTWNFVTCLKLLITFATSLLELWSPIPIILIYQGTNIVPIYMVLKNQFFPWEPPKPTKTLSTRQPNRAVWSRHMGRRPCSTVGRQCASHIWLGLAKAGMRNEEMRNEEMGKWGNEEWGNGEMKKWGSGNVCVCRTSIQLPHFLIVQSNLRPNLFLSQKFRS